MTSCAMAECGADLDDADFEEISLDDRACDICGQDTGERLRQCKICYNPRITDRISLGYNYVPVVLHKSQRAHKRCFIKAHEILHGNSIDPDIFEPRSQGPSPRHTSRDTTRSSFTDKLLKIVHKRSSSGDRRPPSSPQSRRPPSSPQTRPRSRSDAFTDQDLSSDVTDRQRSRMKIAQFYNLPKPETCSKNYYGYMKAESGIRHYGQDWYSTNHRQRHCGGKENQNIVHCSDDCRENKDFEKSPKRQRRLMIRLDDENVSVVDDLTGNDVTVNQGCDVTAAGTEELGQDSVKLLSVKQIESLQKILQDRIHEVSSELVDLVQERCQLREENEVRHVFIEKLLKLRRQE